MTCAAPYTGVNSRDSLSLLRHVARVGNTRRLWPVLNAAAAARPGEPVLIYAKGNVALVDPADPRVPTRRESERLIDEARNTRKTSCLYRSAARALCGDANV